MRNANVGASSASGKNTPATSRPALGIVSLLGVTALRAIDFPTPAQAERGHDLIAAIQAYDDYLAGGYAQGGTLMNFSTADQTLNDARSHATAQLRDALSLPQSICSFKRP